MKKTGGLTTKQAAESFEVLMPLLKSLYNEFKDLSKKNPESAVSKGKVALVNRLLEKVRGILSDQDSLPFLDLLNDDDLPQSSDVTIMLSQYVAAMTAFKYRYFGWDGTEEGWYIKK